MQQQNYSDDAWNSLPKEMQRRLLDSFPGLEIRVGFMTEKEKRQLSNGSHYPVPHFEGGGSEARTYFQVDGRFYRICLSGEQERMQDASEKLVALTSGGINHVNSDYGQHRKNGDKLHHLGRRTGRRPPAYLFGKH